jgi:hypothetical protein
MSDTMKNLFPALVSFITGESPGAVKLNNWAIQEKDAFTELSKAIGNIWNGDNTIQASGEDVHPLTFTNLTRAIGNMEMLNPRFIYGDTRTRYANVLPQGETEVDLDFWPQLPSNYTAEDILSITYATGSGGEEVDASITLDIGSVKLDPSLLVTDGDWTVYGRTLYTYTPTAGGYFIFDGIWKMQDAAISFSVIPCMAQVVATDGMYVQLETIGGESHYILTTPTCTKDYYGNDPHPTIKDTQIPIPKIARYPSETLIPDGLLSLWDLGSPPDPTTATKIDGVMFYGRNDDYSVVAKNCTLEGNNQRYVLVCAAEGLAYAVAYVRDVLIGIMDGTSTYAAPAHAALKRLRFNGTDIYGNPLGWVVPGHSRVARNDHTQYLHRNGFDSQDYSALYNAYLGTLLLASINQSNNYLNTDFDSNKIQFGSGAGPTIYFSQADGCILLDDVPVKTDIYKSKVTTDDTAAGFLSDKLVEGENITITTNTDGQGVQTLSIAATVEGQGPAAEAFPIGSIYLSILDTDPATTLGYGTWEAFAKGQMLIGKADSGTFQNVLDTGGSVTKDLHHTHSTPAHSHSITAQTTLGLGGDATPWVTGITDDFPSGSGTSGSSGSATQDIMPPYVVVYMWRRTA